MRIILVQGNTYVAGDISTEDRERLYKKFNGREILTPEESDEISKCITNKEIHVMQKSIAVNWLKGDA